MLGLRIEVIRKVFMKKYRIKVDSPWGKKNSLIEVKDCPGFRIISGHDILGGFVEPDKYPDIFEEVIELSDEQWLAEWCHDNWLIKWHNYFYPDYKDKNKEFKHQWERLAKALIHHGFDVKKLRYKR